MQITNLISIFLLTAATSSSPVFGQLLSTSELFVPSGGADESYRSTAMLGYKPYPSAAAAWMPLSDFASKLVNKLLPVTAAGTILTTAQNAMLGFDLLAPENATVVQNYFSQQYGHAPNTTGERMQAWLESLLQQSAAGVRNSTVYNATFAPVAREFDNARDAVEKLAAMKFLPEHVKIVSDFVQEYLKTHPSADGVNNTLAETSMRDMFSSFKTFIRHKRAISDISGAMAAPGFKAASGGGLGGLGALTSLASSAGGIGNLANMASSVAGGGGGGNSLGALTSLASSAGGVGNLANIASQAAGGNSLGALSSLASSAGGIGNLANMASQASGGNLGALASLATNTAGSGSASPAAAAAASDPAVPVGVDENAGEQYAEVTAVENALAAVDETLTGAVSSVAGAVGGVASSIGGALGSVGSSIASGISQIPGGDTFLSVGGSLLSGFAGGVWETLQIFILIIDQFVQSYEKLDMLFKPFKQLLTMTLPPAGLAFDSIDTVLCFWNNKYRLFHLENFAGMFKFLGCGMNYVHMFTKAAAMIG